jgi:hypothetical protein
MRIRSLLVVCSLVFAILMVTGCAKMPQQEIDQAKAAVEAARTAQADKYVTADFNAVQDAYNAALTEIEKQKTASPFSRKYDDAKAALLAVVTMANNASAKAAEEKTKVLALVDSVLAQAKASAAQVQELVAAAPQTTPPTAAMDSLKLALAVVDTDLVQAEAQKNSGDIAVAFERINMSITKLDSLKIALTTAIEKASKPAPKPAKKAAAVPAKPATKKVN